MNSLAFNTFFTGEHFMMETAHQTPVANKMPEIAPLPYIAAPVVSAVSTVYHDVANNGRAETQEYYKCLEDIN